MMIKLAEITRNSIVDVIAALIDRARGGTGRIELLGSNGRVLAALAFSKPCAPDGASGTLKFYKIQEDPSAQATGKAVVARIVDANGNEVFSCDVSGPDGDAVIRLNSNDIVAGGPVRINEFTLTMPA